jgi:hypothetical protein
VKVFGIIALVLILLLVILMLIVEPEGDHGPSRHTLPGGVGDTRSGTVEGIWVGDIGSILSSSRIDDIPLLEYEGQQL